jgi:uncharacterized protein (TIGR00304 family)
LEGEDVSTNLEFFYSLGIGLVVVGIIVIFVAIILGSVRRGGAEGKAKVRGAGVILIGPIPLIFGTDKKSVKEVLVLALALIIVVLIITLVWWLR